MDTQTELKNAVGKSWTKYREMMPEFAEIYDTMSGEAYADGVIRAKEKRLMALTAVLIKDCRACILFQAERALDLGATVEELLEVVAVAVSLGGTMAASASTRMLLFLEEQGHI